MTIQSSRTFQFRLTSLTAWLLGICLAALVAGPEANAELRLPGFFGDHMVLQQEMPVRIWGWADPGENVRIEFGEQSAETQADSDGRWKTSLPAMPANASPQTLTVRATNTIEIKDVLVGEVWLCSGQSNMEWAVRSSSNAEQEIANANHPLIRHIKISRNPSRVPLDDVSEDWDVCSPQSVGSFTAVGYFMARKLNAELGVPIGLINSSWGGTRVEPWTAPVGFQKVEAVRDIYQRVLGKTPGSAPYRSAMNKHIAATRKWLANAEQAVNGESEIPPSPAFPTQLVPFKNHQDPTMLYNGMIHPLVGFAIRGAIWYQGESNHVEGMLYFEKKKALINGWRELWGQGDFPFYFVQIAPFQYGNESPVILPQFWEAQQAVTQLPNTAMVVINDIATLNDIHPPNKQDVGLRLANLALANDYGKTDVVAFSPQLKSVEPIDGALKLTFEHTGGGLKTRDNASPTLFEITGAGSGGFQQAEAKIDGDAVILTAKSVSAPTAFRFAWNKLAEPNLTGGTGLPVGACRGGQVPDFFDSVPASNEYELVYEIDLAKLRSDVTYHIDRSSQIGKFDRIAYLVELESNDGAQKSVFVSMDAFTDDVTKIAIPTFESQAKFQQPVTGMQVASTVEELGTGDQRVEGSIEFWPNNYAPNNSASVPGASSEIFDFGDSPGPPQAGYGSMQVHHPASGKTIFAINHWSQGGQADLGIGNSPGNTRDWTFTGNAASYSNKRLRVYVRPAGK